MSTNREILTRLKAIYAYLRRQPLTVLLAIAIWIVCLIPVPEVPQLQNINMFDKWTHFVMYGVLVLVCLVEYGRRRDTVEWGRLLLMGVGVPVVMSGAIELCQAYLTNGVRSGDWIDFFANCIGAVLGAVLGAPIVRVLTRSKKE